MVNKCDNPEHRRDKIHATPMSVAEQALLKELAAYMGTSMSAVMRQAFFDLALTKGFTLPSSSRRKGNDWQY